ncbi:hypothetical protein KJ966_16555 [bacterium]|nr:hypothetical protein [bacterium]
MKTCFGKCLSCLAILIAIFAPAFLQAQVVTAPFDPTSSVDKPAAAGWREGKSIGLVYNEASGNRTVDSDEAYKFETSGTSVNGHLKFSNISFDAAWKRSKTDAKVERFYESRVNLDYDISSANIALTGNDFVAVGLGIKIGNSTDYFDATHDSETTTQTSVAGSISVKPMDIFFIGGGFERVKEESSYTVDNVWNVTTLGLALMLGEPGGTRFRTEYAYSSSPHESSSGQGDLHEAVHNETTTSMFAAELMMSGLLFSAKTSEKRIRLEESVSFNGKNHEEMIFNEGEAGVLWVPQDGVALGFYFASSQTTFFYKDDNTAFKINIGYVFQ